MPVQIIINGENAGESIKELATLSAALTGKTEAPKEEQKPVNRKQKNEETPKKQPTPEPEPEKQPEPEQPDQAPEENLDDFDDALYVPTLVEIRAKAKEKSETPDGKAKIKQLLSKFEVAAISKVPEEKYAAFYAELVTI